MSQANPDNQTERKTILKAITFIIIANILIQLMITAGIIILNIQFLFDLFDLLLKSIDALSLFILFSLFSILGIILFEEYVLRKYYSFNKKRVDNIVVGSATIILVIMVSLGIIYIYQFLIPDFPLIRDPFGIDAISPILADLYFAWWFLGFVGSVLIGALIYIGVWF